MASGEIRLEGARRLPGRRAGPRLPADGRHGQQLAPVERRARRRPDAPRGAARRCSSRAERRAFGKRLIDMPLMRRQLQQAAAAGRAGAHDGVPDRRGAAPLRRAATPGAYPLLRILTPLIKFRACRDARKVTGDAMEVRGGCGYIEEWADPRLVRDAHLGSIWEGTSNIVALDVIRAVHARGLAAGAAGALRARCSATRRCAPAFAAALRDALGRAAALAATRPRHGSAATCWRARRPRRSTT